MSEQFTEVVGFVLDSLGTEIEASHDQAADTGESPFADYVEVQQDRSLLLVLSGGEQYRVTVESAEDTSRDRVARLCAEITNEVARLGDEDLDTFVDAALYGGRDSQDAYYEDGCEGVLEAVDLAVRNQEGSDEQ